MFFMPRQTLFSIICLILGFAIGALGMLVVFAQCIEWWSFGNWNQVSVRYAFEYFTRHSPNLILTASLDISKIFNRLRDGLLNLPLSIVLLGIGCLITAIGRIRARQTAK